MPIDFGIDRVATARLAGRRPELGDLAAYQRMFTDPRVDEELWPEHLRTADRAETLLRDLIARWERWGFGPWTALLDGAPIGYVGLRHADVGGRPEVELMWFLDAGQWGHGYSTELAREAVRVAFDVLEPRRGRRPDGPRQPRLARGDGEARHDPHRRHGPRRAAARGLPPGFIKRPQLPRAGGVLIASLHAQAESHRLRDGGSGGTTRIGRRPVPGRIAAVHRGVALL